MKVSSHSSRQSELFLVVGAASYAPYMNEHERLMHRHCMEAVAEEMHVPIEDVEVFYEEALKEMTNKASIREYLPILVSKNVKRTLRRLRR